MPMKTWLVSLKSRMAPSEATRRNKNADILLGAAFGAALELPAAVAALMSAGAGYGHYVAARALFPFSMLLTLVEGKIGWFSGGLALLQFPIYGALLGSARRQRPLFAVSIGAVHLAAAAACFAGTLPYFS